MAIIFKVRTAESPCLSHHSGAVIHDRFWILIGGWDGKVRTSKVNVYDVQENCWKFPKTWGFEEGAGLSSHATCLLGSGDILVVGREGSTKYQRRCGSGWLLHGSVTEGFSYTKLAGSFHSRSGHSMNISGKRLVICGGRSDELLEIHEGYQAVTTDCSVITQLARLARTLPPMKKPPCGRKNHTSTCGCNILLIHGGETFDGKSREPVPNTYLVALKPHIAWYELPSSPRGRQGHSMVTTATRVLFHGGEGQRGHIASDSYELKVS